uniref:Uncharacterized protein n=1 Tax=Anguilla anguilla TaxID=7936 RepID=A0A0E9UGK2_ANGAN
MCRFFLRAIECGPLLLSIFVHGTVLFHKARNSLQCELQLHNVGLNLSH